MTRYELRVAGHLDGHWAGWFGYVASTRNGDGTTTLLAPVADQAQLHGLLTGLHDIGVPLLSLRTVDAAPRPMLERPLHTERLRLRPATVDDVEATWRFRRLPEVSRWLTSAPADVDAYRAIILDPARLAATVIIELRDRARPVVGDLMLLGQDAWAQSEVTDRASRVQAEVGWVVDPTYAGRGYATEAAHALIHHCFTDLGVRRVVASAFADNEASVRLMTRLGMRREGHAVRDSLHRSGRWLDTVTYALLAEEWEAEDGCTADHPPRIADDDGSGRLADDLRAPSSIGRAEDF